MNYKILVGIIFVCQLTIILSAPTICTGINEVFNECGHNCSQTCGVDDDVCTLVCVPGCYCKDGYRRSYTGVCVAVDKCFDCPGINEFYTVCGSNCTDSCNKDSDDCPYECNKGCFCKDGYKRNAQGVCVPPEQCCCDPNEEFKEEEDSCIERCDTTYCITVKKAGCFCKLGYKRDPSNGRCIPQCQCPKYGQGKNCKFFII